MERVRDAFIALLRAGLWGRDPLSEGFSRLDDGEWNEVFGISGRQTVTGIVFDGICRLPDDLLPSDGIFAKWVAVVSAIENRNARMNTALKDLVKAFTDNGLRPVLQKGQCIAELYPVPSHRECGDIDLYFPAHRSLSLPKGSGKPSEAGPFDTSSSSVSAKHWDLAEEIVRSKGVNVSRMPDGSLSYEWERVEVEHHPMIVGLSDPFQKGWVRTLLDDPGTRPSSLADGLMVPSPKLNALMLNVHILKHAMGKGVGLRQMCDLAMVYHRISESGGKQEMGERIFCLYRRAWIQKWSRLLHSFLVEVIGLPEDELPYPEMIVPVGPLLRIVEDGGNFGQYRSKRFGKDHSRLSSGHLDRGASVPEPVEGLMRGKLDTAGMFVRRAGFSLRFAPNEAFWTVVNLAVGQFKSRRK